MHLQPSCLHKIAPVSALGDVNPGGTHDSGVNIGQFLPKLTTTPNNLGSYDCGATVLIAIVTSPFQNGDQLYDPANQGESMLLSALAVPVKGSIFSTCPIGATLRESPTP